MSTVKNKLPTWIPHEKGEPAKYRANPELYKAQFNAKKAQDQQQAMQQAQGQIRHQTLTNQLQRQQKRINFNYERNGSMYPGMVKQHQPIMNNYLYKYIYGMKNNYYGRGFKPGRTRKNRRKSSRNSRRKN